MAFRDLADRLLGRPPKRERLELPRPPTSDEILAELAQFEADVHGKVPDVVGSRIKRVADRVRDIVPRLDQLGAGNPQAYSVMATATSYLPEAVGGYLRLPRHWADSRPVSNGKTSLLVLCDQLDLLGATMDRILDAVLRADAAALVAHGAFLQEKFGTAGGALSLDQATPGRLQPPEGTS